MSLREAFADLFRVGLDVLTSALGSSTSALLVNLGDAKSGFRDTDQSDVWGAVQGVTCMPANPTGAQGPACQAIVLSGGNRDITLLLRDVRKASKVGAMAPGDSCLWETAGGTARIYARATGEISIIANDGAQSITIDPSGAITIDGGIVSVGPNAASVSIAGGGPAIGRVGDSVAVTLTSVDVGAISAPSGGGPCTLASPFLVLTGAITSGSPKTNSA